jgi:tRNA (guanine9-N1)-methyltransferase
MASRHVLTVNQVLEIMLQWLVSQDWEKAFMDIIPKRKLPETQANKEVDSEQENGQTISDQDQQGSAEITEEIDESENEGHVNAEEGDDAQGCI